MTEGVPPDGQVESSEGMSTGAKLLFGCFGVAVLGAIALAVVVTIGGLALKRGVETAMGTVGDQAEASEMLQELEDDHPFTPPSDGAVLEEHVDRFAQVTEDVWQEMRGWAEEIEELREMTRDGDGLNSLSDLAAGARAMGGFARARVVLAEALADQETSLGEYLWTGVNLSKAAEALESGAGTGIPTETLRILERRASDLPNFDSDDAGSGLVLAIATLWGMADLSAWQAIGLDTLLTR